MLRQLTGLGLTLIEHRGAKNRNRERDLGSVSHVGQLFVVQVLEHRAHTSPDGLGCAELGGRDAAGSNEHGVVVVGENKVFFWRGSIGSREGPIA